MSKYLPLVRLPSRAVVHRFGTPPNAPRSSALLRFPEKSWTIGRDPSEIEGWAVVGDGEGRRLAVETLLSRHRIQPNKPPPGHFPYLTSLLDASQSSSTSSTSEEILNSVKPVRHLAFARPPVSGEFTDFTARYGALHEEDRLTFRETLANLHPPPSDSEVERVAKTMKIDHLLDLPTVSFSSGQTRRARISAALLTKPSLLILEDPMAGLDVASRKEVSNVLGELNAKGGIRIVLVLKGKGGEGMPEWITDVAEVRGGDVWIGSKGDYEDRQKDLQGQARIDEIEEEVSSQTSKSNADAAEEPVVRLTEVSVSYGEGTRKVLEEVSWTIRPGEKWHLVGANGSGKTTLLSLVLGHHPRSFSLPASALELFSKPRRDIPMSRLRQMIGHTSPEMFASFPRGMGLSAYAAVGTGFEGVFSRRDLTPEQKDRVLCVLDEFKDLLKPVSRSAVVGNGGPDGEEVDVIDIAKRQFSHFTPPQQALLLFLRAIINRPKLLILDEPSQGMDEAIWQRCTDFLEKQWESEEARDQAVIVVSHYEDEVPWKKGKGKILKLDKGRATIADND